MKKKYHAKAYTEGMEHNGQHFSGVELICRKLIMEFPENNEANVIRSGLDFFNFTPRSGESIREVFNRFERQLATADEFVGMRFTYEFKSWMLMSVLRLSSRKWSELLKDNGRKMPSTQEEYHKLRDDLHRERIIEETLDQSSTQAKGQSYHAEPIQQVPLYMCLGNPMTDGDTDLYPTCAKSSRSGSTIMKRCHFLMIRHPTKNSGNGRATI